MIPYDKRKSQSDRLRVEFTAYLSKALDATMINFCREQRRQRAIYDALIQRDFSARESEDIYSQSTYFKEQLEEPALESAINNLNYRYRYILYARIIEERSFEEIGLALGLNYKGVAAIYYRALRKIREEVKHKHGF